MLKEKELDARVLCLVLAEGPNSSQLPAQVLTICHPFISFTDAEYDQNHTM